MRVLGIETSCDETAAAVYDGTRGLLADEIYSQVDLHAHYGGVVPELAARDHLRKLLPLLEKTVETSGGRQAIEGVAYTSGPGLVGALLVGAAVARSLAYAWRKPAIGVAMMTRSGAACVAICAISAVADAPSNANAAGKDTPGR